MSLTLGYRIPGSREGQAFTVPDICHGHITFEDSDRIAADLRARGQRVTWQKVRGVCLSLASRRAAAKKSA